jgi:hypothetical protein
MNHHYKIISLVLLLLLGCEKNLPVEQGKLISTSATSVLKGGYPVDNLIDRTSKSWCEGHPDQGLNESIAFIYDNLSQSRRFI